MEQKRSTRLVLKTSDLTVNSTTNIGSCDQYRQNFTWFNINLRALLGDQYDQYDYFNISLVSMSCSQASTVGGQGSVDDKTVYVKMSGLPFINQTYNQPTRNNITSSTLTIFQIPSSAIAATQQYNNSTVNVITFGKNQDLCNINIFLTRLIDDARSAITTAFPQFVFIFTIIGVDKSYNPDRINYLLRL
jgi:hypothetical protein